ncbi:MAG: hypothetical protein H7343_12235 [Undibacterium sp.]|nr:hypothetical protein [Opitutaceae bacterium]
MTFAALLPLLLQYAPQAIGLIEHCVINIAAGRSQATVTPADWAELDRLAALTGADIYRRLGLTPPPA